MKMKWAMIATWEMSYEGVVEAAKLLESGAFAGDAVEKAIIRVEDDPSFTSVGYGGLPNQAGEVELDAAYMDGDTFQYGAVGAVKDFKNPILIARKLSAKRSDNFLVGHGAESYASRHGFQRINLLTRSSQEQWRKALEEKNQNPHSYQERGHDTVCVIGLDQNGSLIVGTSTSGLFMKEPGRLGDTPILGCGFFADSQIGAAAATGLGEDIIRGCLSYEAVKKMERGYSAQEAAASTIDTFAKKLMNMGRDRLELSLICMDKEGNCGAGSTLRFPYVTASAEEKPAVCTYIPR